MKPSKQLGTVRALPTKLDFYVNATQLIRFTLWQRFLIALGYGVLLRTHLRAQHSPGRFLPILSISLTPHKERDEAYKNLRTSVPVYEGIPHNQDDADDGYGEAQEKKGVAS